jgi:hypothetical protein
VPGCLREGRRWSQRGNYARPRKIEREGNRGRCAALHVELAGTRRTPFGNAVRELSSGPLNLGDVADLRIPNAERSIEIVHVVNEAEHQRLPVSSLLSEEGPRLSGNHARSSPTLSSTERANLYELDSPSLMF